MNKIIENLPDWGFIIPALIVGFLSTIIATYFLRYVKKTKRTNEEYAKYLASDSTLLIIEAIYVAVCFLATGIFITLGLMLVTHNAVVILLAITSQKLDFVNVQVIKIMTWISRIVIICGGMTAGVFLSAAVSFVKALKLYRSQVISKINPINKESEKKSTGGGSK